MKRIYNGQQLRDWDKFTIKEEGILSSKLIERAAEQCTRWINSHFNKDQEVLVVAGTGNNGGDGLVIARQLKKLSYKPKVIVIKFSETYSEDFLINMERAGLVDLKVLIVESRDELNSIETNSNTILIDAVFGTGLSRVPAGLAADAIQWINEQRAVIVSIDTPSGMFCDLDKENTHEHIVHADVCLSFECPKISFLLPEAGINTGLLEIIPIGLSDRYQRDVFSPYYFIEEEDILYRLKLRNKFDHKGKFGHTVLISGSYGKMGAAVLASKASISMGAGLTSVHCPRRGIEIIQTAVPEAMVEVNAGEFYLEGESDFKGKAIAIGPGIGKEEGTAGFIKALFETHDTPMLIDADALNLISEHEELRALIPKNSILTPHPKELERLVGKWSSEEDKLDRLKRLSEERQVYIVLKGAHSITASPNGRMYFNSTGNPGMATGGSGDVLTGILTALLAQAYKPEDACIIGVYIHGLAGDLAYRDKAVESISASDIISYISEALVFLVESTI